MIINTTTCDCCDEQTHHMTFTNDSITFDGDSFELHLTQDELQDLYLSAKEILLYS